MTLWGDHDSLTMFSLDGCERETREEYADETCDGPTCWCAPPAKTRPATGEESPDDQA